MTGAVLILGHPIVDVVCKCRDDLIDELGLVKGTMTLVDPVVAVSLYASVEPDAEVSGGSAANTAAALASLGARARFVGKVAGDSLGATFAEDIRAAGVDFDVSPLEGGAGTGRCLVLVTPDAEKTMCTYLGAGETLAPHDVPSLDDGVRAVYFEGYLCKDSTQPAVDAAIKEARSAGAVVAMSASDPGWVALRGRAMRELLPQLDILLANEPEALALAGTSTVAAAVPALLEACPAVVVTRGENGSVVGTRGARPVHVPAAPVRKVVDTTGAGDSFAAGFLYGVMSGFESERSARLGALAAAEVVSHLGARPRVRLRDLATRAGLL